MTGPYSDKTSNAGFDDYWTCPGCYSDLHGIGEGIHTCPNCKRVIECTVETQPVCHCELSEEEKQGLEF